MQDFLNSWPKLEFDKVKQYIQRYILSNPAVELLEKLAPSSSIDEIKSNLALVSEVKRLLETDDLLPLEHIPDVRVSLHRSAIEDYVLTPEELHGIALLLGIANKVHSYFIRRKVSYPLMSSMIIQIQLEKVLQYNINQAIDEEGEVKDSASKELAYLRKHISEKTNYLRKNLESILASVAGKDWVQEEIITTREGRMVIPVKVEYKNRVPGFIHSSSSSGATVFIEPTETLELNNEIRTLQFQEQREISRILKGLTQQVRENREKILAIFNILVKLDFIHAKAKYSIEIIGSEPVVKSEGVLRMVNAYHPILLQKHKREEVVPLDIEIGARYNTLVITGPNAGGKSVAMKTVGLLTVLVQSGCHIPALPETEVKVFSKIFVDMGDEQSIENDLSSFSSHLKNLDIILENIDNSSLVLIDEIGTGTDPIDGASLGAAVLEHLSNIGCLTIATTHHGTLKSFAFEHPRMENGAMEFDLNTLKPTYNFRPGIPGSSYALEIAQRMSLPEQLISRSRDLKGTEATNIERLIIQLESHSQELKRSLTTIQKEKDQLSGLIALYQNKITQIEKEVKAVKSQALKEAELIVTQANSVIEKVVREIKEKTAEKEAIKTAKEEVKRINEEVRMLKKELEEHADTHLQFKLGEEVQIKQSTVSGEISAQIDEDNYEVLIGGMRVKIHRKDILHLQPKVKVNVKSVHQLEFAPLSQPEIDLRGMYGDEAIQTIERFLDKAILSGLHRINIIHGKGSGLLRQKITEYLRSNASIKSFRLGEWNEGGSGVTVVEIK